MKLEKARIQPQVGGKEMSGRREEGRGITKIVVVQTASQKRFEGLLQT